MDEARTTAVDATRKEGHAQGFIMGDSLESPDKISTLQVLQESETQSGHVISAAYL